MLDFVSIKQIKSMSLSFRFFMYFDFFCKESKKFGINQK